MKKYCKAYLLSDLRRFANWSDGTQPVEGELTDEAIVYLTDEFDVLADPTGKPKVIFSKVTPEWKEFCTTTLDFKIPEDLAFAYAESTEE